MAPAGQPSFGSAAWGGRRAGCGVVGGAASATSPTPSRGACVAPAVEEANELFLALGTRVADEIEQFGVGRVGPSLSSASFTWTLRACGSRRG